MQGTNSDRFKLEYWQPAPSLTGYISGYHRYGIDLDPGDRFADVFFPAWTNLRFVIESEQWSIRIGRRTYFPGEASLFGVTSHAGYVDAGRGTLFGIGITPMGWSRLFDRGADEFADKVVPLDVLIGAEAGSLAAALAGGAAAKDLFDAWLVDRLTVDKVEDGQVARIFELIGDPAMNTVAALVDATGIGERSLTRITRRQFGFPPKLLLRRSRFLRALISVQALPHGNWARAAAAAGYHDQSHFLRDCHLFLDMSLSQFIHLPKPMVAISLQLRMQTLGAPIQGLHRE